MTLGELKRSVLALGFERELDDATDLLPAIRRSLHTLFTDRPVLKTVKLPRPNKQIRLVFEELHHRPGNTESYTVIGSAISFTVAGKGSYKIANDGGIEREYSFDASFKPIRLFISGYTTLSFTGEYGYTVFNLAVCCEVTSEMLDDVPLWEERLTVDLKKLGDYLGPYGQPQSLSGVPIAGAHVLDGILHLPEDHYGAILLTYRRTPVMPSGYDDDELLDIPSEVSELLPLLVASYIWLDDDYDKAELYRSLYRDGISTLIRFMPRETGAAYLTNGWA